MTTFVLTVVGADRPGLVSALSAAVAEHEGNWLTSRMAQLAGQFAGIVLVEVPAGRAVALRAALGGLTADGLQVVVTEAAAEAAATAHERTGGRGFTVALLGNDRPGIVRQITGALAAHGASIEDLETGTREAPMAGGLLFEAHARVLLPPGVDLDALRRTLEELAGELLVDLELTDD